MKSELKTYQLEEIALNICDGVHNTVIDDENGDCLLLSAKNIQNGRIIFDDTDRKINRELCDKLKKRTHLSKNDIAITTVGANVGDLAIIGDGSENYEFQRSVGLIKTNTAIADSIYLFYLLGTKSFNYFFHVIATGSAQPCLFLGTLNKIKVTLPALSKQKRIASILSAYDNLIENNNKRIKILEQMAENLYKEWFVRFRFPGHETTPLENGIPKGWRVEKVANYAKIKSGYAFKSEWWQNNGFPVIKIKDIDNGSIDIANLDCVSEEHANKAKSFLLSEGDLVIAMTGATIGKIGLVPKIDNLYTNQRVGKFFLGKNPFEKMPILYCLFSQPTTIELILGLSGASSAQPNISPDQLGRIEFFYEEKIVKEFNRINTPIFKEILKLREHNLSLIKQRDLLLPRLMSGKLAV